MQKFSSVEDGHVLVNAALDDEKGWGSKRLGVHLGVMKAHMGSNYLVIHHTPRAPVQELHAIFGSFYIKKIANLERIQIAPLMTHSQRESKGRRRARPRVQRAVQTEETTDQGEKAPVMRSFLLSPDTHTSSLERIKPVSHI